ncbi:hypothetical protein ACQF4J_16570 [Streptomyces sp. C1-1]|uniref:hypothetical protein n=1 Tax=Streptomyces sp. C1-1 TaxID=3231173 RepID=UPI003D0301D3
MLRDNDAPEQPQQPYRIRGLVLSGLTIPTGAALAVYHSSRFQSWFLALALLLASSIVVAFVAAVYVLLFTGSGTERRRAAMALLDRLPFLRPRR